MAHKYRPEKMTLLTGQPLTGCVESTWSYATISKEKAEETSSWGTVCGDTMGGLENYCTNALGKQHGEVCVLAGKERRCQWGENQAMQAHHTVPISFDQAPSFSSGDERLSSQEPPWGWRCLWVTLQMGRPCPSKDGRPIMPLQSDDRQSVAHLQRTDRWWWQKDNQMELLNGNKAPLQLKIGNPWI